jgi:hypothetical protein
MSAKRRRKNASSGGSRRMFKICGAFALVVMVLYFYFVNTILHSAKQSSVSKSLDQILITMQQEPPNKDPHIQPSIDATSNMNKSMNNNEHLSSSINKSDHLQTNEKDSVKKTSIEQKQKPVPTMPRPSCFDDGKLCRFDDIGKYLEDASKFTIIHAPTDAIPNRRRIPSSMANNATYIASRHNSGPKDGSQTSLADYNPTLLPLNSDLDDKLLDYLTGRYHPDITNEEADRAKYLLISRASNLHNCGLSMRRLNRTVNEHSYLSLALLDDNLQHIPGASASVLAYQALLPECIEKSYLSPFQDYQIIAARSTIGNKKKDQLFMMASDVKTVITPIDIRRVPRPTNDAKGWNTKIKSKPIPMIQQKDDEFSILFYGTGLQVRFMENIRPPKVKSCVTILAYNSFDWKKNYHVFDIPDPDGKGAMLTYTELRPHNIRKTRKVNFYSDKFDRLGDWELVPNGTIHLKKDGKRDVNDIQTNQFRGGEPSQQFDAIKGVVMPLMSGRGTACCVDIDLGQNQTFKVGISHSTTDSRGYISRFYAFDLRPPRFLIVAMSGPFCLGGLNSDSDINADLQIFPMPDTRHLHASNITFECPAVTFASGITEYQADKNYVVISYGVNDCYSRSIVVPKQRIIEFLDIKGRESWLPWNFR